MTSAPAGRAPVFGFHPRFPEISIPSQGSRDGTGGHADGCGNPGRGFNLFKALRLIFFRARVTAKPGGHDKTLIAIPSSSSSGLPFSSRFRVFSRRCGAICESPSTRPTPPERRNASRLEPGGKGRRGRWLRQSPARIRPVFRALVTAKPGGHDKTLIAIPGSSSSGLPFATRFRVFSRRCGAICESPSTA